MCSKARKQWILPRIYRNLSHIKCASVALGNLMKLLKTPLTKLIFFCAMYGYPRIKSVDEVQLFKLESKVKEKCLILLIHNPSKLTTWPVKTSSCGICGTVISHRPWMDSIDTVWWASGTCVVRRTDPAIYTNGHNGASECGYSRTHTSTLRIHFTKKRKMVTLMHQTLIWIMIIKIIKFKQPIKHISTREVKWSDCI